MLPLRRASVAALAAGLVAVACSRGAAHDGSPGVAQSQVQSFRLQVSAVDTTFTTRDHFIASVEMQLSGEPFAEAMGRQLAGYSRDFACQESICSPSVYYDPALNGGVAGGPVGRIDLAGFSSARRVVRVLEAADEQHRVRVGRRDVARVRAARQPDRRDGAARDRAPPRLGAAARRRGREHDVVARHRRHDAARQPARLAWLLADAAAVHAVRPDASDPTSASTGCSISSDDDPGASGALHCADYECDDTTLHLPDRDAQVEPTITPGAVGLAGWKDGALGPELPAGDARLDREPRSRACRASDLAHVGTPGNTVARRRRRSDRRRARTSARATSRASRPRCSSSSSTTGPSEWLAPAHDDRRRDALAASRARRRARLRRRRAAALVPRRDRGDRGAPTTAASRARAYAIASRRQRPARSRRASLGAYASALRAHRSRPTRTCGGSQPALAYFDGDPFPADRTSSPTARARCTTARSR